jgi:hypothetical protein
MEKEIKKLIKKSEKIKNKTKNNIHHFSSLHLFIPEELKLTERDKLLLPIFSATDPVDTLDCCCINTSLSLSLSERSSGSDCLLQLIPISSCECEFEGIEFEEMN